MSNVVTFPADTDVHIRGALHPIGGLSIPAGTIVDADVSSGAAIGAAKLDHQYALTLETETGSAVADVTKLVHVAKAAGTLVAVPYAIDVANVGDSTIVVDVQKSTAGGAFATMLGSAITLTTSPAAKTGALGTVGAAGVISYVAGDIIQITVDATVGTGTLGQGLSVVAYVREAA